MKALDMIDARSNSYKSILLHNKPFKVISCLITLTAFFVNIFIYDLALLRPLGFVGQAWADRVPPILTKELNPNAFALPQSLGTVKDVWTPVLSASRRRQSSPIVIQIQDAHCNYNAQKKIAEIIKYINDNYGIRAINLEGGAKGYDLSVFTSIADKEIREKTADYFVKDGLVNGAEYFAVNNPEKITLWGIEDPALYVDNLNVYRNFLTHKDEVEVFLKSLSCILTNLKIKIYSKELLEFDTKYSQYKADNLGFKEYLTYLLGEAKAKAIDIKPYHNIFLLNQAQQEESAIDFNKANNERDQLIDMLHKKLSKNAMEELVVKTVEFKAEKISQKDFYNYLMDKAKKAGISLQDLPEFTKYIVYIALYDAMDKMKIMDEVDVLEAKIKEASFENETQGDLARLSKNLAIMKNVFNISLTRDDYRYYEANEDAFRLSSYKRFIDANAPKYNITAKLNGNIADIDRYRDEISKFYEYSFKRDSAFVKNLKFASNGQVPQSASILITGGFHTNNLCDMFKKEGISYISIIPNFKNDEGYKSPYFSLLAGNQNPVEARISNVLHSTMAIASCLNSLGRMVNGKDEYIIFGLYVRWVAEVANNKDGIKIKNGDNVLGVIGRDGSIIPEDKWANFNNLAEVRITEFDASYQLEASEKTSAQLKPATPIAAPVTPATIIEAAAMIEAWEYVGPDGNKVRLTLNADTPSNISRILNDILKNKSVSEDSFHEIAGTPAILAKLCLIYEDSKPEDAEKNVIGWIEAYDKKIEFVAPTAKEKIDKLSWSAIFDLMDNTSDNPVRDRSSLSIIPFLKYAIVEGIHNIELPLDYMSFSPAVRLAGEYSDDELDKVNAICEENGLTISFHSPLIGPQNSKTQGKQLFEDPADNIPMMQEQIRRAGLLTAAKMMVVHLVNPKKIAEYAGLVLYARKNAPDLRIVFENYQNKNKVFPSAESFMEAFTSIVAQVVDQDRSKSALNNIGIVLDAAHYNLTGNEDPIVSAFIIAKGIPVLAKQYDIESKVWIKWLAELHTNQNLGPIDCFGKKFSADIHSRASREGPINSLGIIAMLILMGYDPIVTLEQLESLDENDIGLLAVARALAEGKSLAEVEALGKTILEDLQKVKDYKGFFSTQVADKAKIEDAYRAYSILAGLIGEKEFEKHIQERVLQKILTIHSEEEFNSVKRFMPIVTGADKAEYPGITLEKSEKGTKVIIREGEVVNIDDKGTKVLYFVLKGNVNVTKNGKTLGEVGPGNFVGEMAVISDNHECTATVTLKAGTVVFAIAGSVIKDMRRLMPDFEELLKTYKGMREEADKAAAPAPANMREDLLRRFKDFKRKASEGDWVVKFDGPRIGATNDVYGRAATDWFVAEIIKRTVMDVALQNNIPAEVGGKNNDEFTFCFPATLSEDDIRIKMDDLMQSLKRKCDQYQVITLSTKLDASQIKELKNKGAMFVYSVGIYGKKEVRTKIIFDMAVEDNIVNLLLKSGQAIKERKGLRVPYPVSAVARLGADHDFEKAARTADKLQEQYKNTPIEDGGELLIFKPPMVNTEKEHGVIPLVVDNRYRNNIENAISEKATSLDSTPYAVVEPIYGVYNRFSLGSLLAELHKTPPSERLAGIHFIRGPPNEFYVIDVKANGLFELVKFDTLFFVPDPKRMTESELKMAEQFNEILTSSRPLFKIKNDNRMMFGFKAINTIFGHDDGNFVIKAIRYSLDKAFDKHRDASLEDKTDEAAKELNRIFNGSGFRCFIMASHITEKEADDSKGDKYFVDSVITRVDDLLRARDVLIFEEIPSGGIAVDYIVKSHSAYKDLDSKIADNLELARYHNMIDGEKTIAGVDEDLAAKAQALHEVIAGIEEPAALSAPEHRVIANVLDRRNWYYAKLSSADRDLFDRKVLGGLRAGVQKLIKDLVVKNLKADGITIDDSDIKGIYIYGSWCYALNRQPLDIDISVIVKGVNENKVIKEVPIDNPDQWFFDKSRIVKTCDIEIMSEDIISSSGPKNSEQKIAEAYLWGHGVPIMGMDTIERPSLLDAPSSETLFNAVAGLLLAAEWYAMEMNNKDEAMKAHNLDKLERIWIEVLNILSYLMIKHELTEIDEQAIRKLLSLKPGVRRGIETKNMGKVLVELRSFKQALYEQRALWKGVPAIDSKSGTYRTEVTVAAGESNQVTVAEYDKNGIIPGTERILSGGESLTVISMIGKGGVIVQAPVNVSADYTADKYSTLVTVTEGIVWMKTHEEDDTIGNGVFLRAGQSAIIVGRVEAPTIASESYMEDLDGRQRELAKTTVPVSDVAPQIATTSVTDDLEAFNEIFEDMPALKTKSMDNLMKSIEARSANQEEVESVLKTLQYIAGVTKDARTVLRGLSPDGKRFVLIPISKILCGVDPASLQSKLHSSWSGVRNVLRNKYQMGNVTLAFYDGTLKEADEKLTDFVTDGATQENTVVYIDAMTNENIDKIKSEIDKAAEEERSVEGDVAKLYKNIMEHAYTIKDTADAQGGYLSITGHIAFALGVLELIKTDDSIYFAQVMALMQRISPSAENYGTDKDKFLNDLKNGQITLKLPPITKIDIDGNMKTYFIAEIAASTAL